MFLKDAKTQIYSFSLENKQEKKPKNMFYYYDFS